MSIDTELIKKCVALDKANMKDNFLDGEGNQIEWDKLEELITRSIVKGAILKSITKQTELKGYLLYRVQESHAYVLSIQVARPGENPFILKSLLKISCSELRNNNFDWINTSVDKKNKKSISLHKKLGFDLVEEKKTSLSFQISRRLLLEKLHLFFHPPKFNPKY